MTVRLLYVGNVLEHDCQLSCSCVIAIACIIVFLNEINGDGDVDVHVSLRLWINFQLCPLIVILFSIRWKKEVHGTANKPFTILNNSIRSALLRLSS